MEDSSFVTLVTTKEYVTLVVFLYTILIEGNL